MQSLIFGFCQRTGGLGHEIHIPRWWQLGGTDHGPCILLDQMLAFSAMPLPYPRSLLLHLALLFIHPFSGSYVLV